MLKAFDIKNKIGVTNWKTDDHEHAHITIKPAVCAKCPHQVGSTGCPTECFKIYDGVMKFIYEDSIECGVFDIMCEQGSVEWHNPRGTFGVQYDNG